jgi:hypothetical protein
MEWWSAQRNEHTKILIASGRARQHHDQCKWQHKERDHRTGLDGYFDYFWGFRPLSKRRFELWFKASPVKM